MCSVPGGPAKSGDAGGSSSSVSWVSPLPVTAVIAVTAKGESHRSFLSSGRLCRCWDLCSGTESRGGAHQGGRYGNTHGWNRDPPCLFGDLNAPKAHLASWNTSAEMGRCPEGSCVSGQAVSQALLPPPALTAPSRRALQETLQPTCQPCFAHD